MSNLRILLGVAILVALMVVLALVAVATVLYYLLGIPVVLVLALVGLFGVDTREPILSVMAWPTRWVPRVMGP